MELMPIVSEDELESKVKFLCGVLEDNYRVEVKGKQCIPLEFGEKSYLLMEEEVFDEVRELIEDHRTEDMSIEDCVKFLLEEGYINM